MKYFDKLKNDFLNKRDKSRKGSIDKPIIKLISKINSSNNYFTTSSCSGRIVLLEKKSEKKNEAGWIFKTHNKAEYKEIKQALDDYIQKSSSNELFCSLWLRFEPAIFHIACRAIEDAQKIVDIARAVGFKRSGIQSTRKKVVVEIGSSEIIDTIVAENGKALVHDDYLRILIEESNKKMASNKKKINNLYAKIAEREGFSL